MRVWIPGEDALRVHEGGHELARAQIADGLGLPLYDSPGLSVRFRFVHAIEPGLLTYPEFPEEPSVVELADGWARELEGVVWRSAGQIVQLFARREYGRAAGLEVSL